MELEAKKYWLNIAAIANVRKASTANVVSFSLRSLLRLILISLAFVILWLVEARGQQQEGRHILRRRRRHSIVIVLEGHFRAAEGACSSCHRNNQLK